MAGFTSLHLEQKNLAENTKAIVGPYNPLTYEGPLGHDEIRYPYPLTWDKLGKDMKWWAEYQIPLSNVKALEQLWDFYTTFLSNDDCPQFKAFNDHYEGKPETFLERRRRSQADSFQYFERKAELLYWRRAELDLKTCHDKETSGDGSEIPDELPLSGKYNVGIAANTGALKDVDALKVTNITIPRGRKKLGRIRGQKGSAMNKENEENKHVNGVSHCLEKQAIIDAGDWETKNNKVNDAYCV